MDEIGQQLALLTGVATMAPTERGVNLIDVAIRKLVNNIDALRQRAEATEKRAASLAAICNRRWDLLHSAVGFVPADQIELVTEIQHELDEGGVPE